jgi:hypothetical protein
LGLRGGYDEAVGEAFHFGNIKATSVFGRGPTALFFRNFR